MPENCSKKENLMSHSLSNFINYFNSERNTKHNLEIGNNIDLSDNVISSSNVNIENLNDNINFRLKSSKNTHNYNDHLLQRNVASFMNNHNVCLDNSFNRKVSQFSMQYNTCEY